MNLNILLLLLVLLPLKRWHKNERDGLLFISNQVILSTEPRVIRQMYQNTQWKWL